MGCVEILFGFLEPAFDDVNFGYSEEARQQQYRVVSSELVFLLGDKFVQLVVRFLSSRNYLQSKLLAVFSSSPNRPFRIV